MSLAVFLPVEELRVEHQQMVPLLKEHWAKDGKCDFGDKCKFTNGDESAAKVEPASRAEEGHDRRDRSRNRR